MARLSEQEKQEIFRFIEAGKPLPDKYRFLLFDEKREVELVWNGKTGEVCNIVLPFQVIEHVDEPRSEKEVNLQPDLFDTKSGRQLKGWTNKLIWGDNKLILSSLKNGPLREEIEKQGGIKLIYIDPPFDVGADFSMDIEIGDDTFTKKPNILEELAYRDTWGKGADSFIAMIYERLVLMRDLLAEDGSIYVHCDWRVNSFIRLALDEVFGKGNHRNEIIWCYTRPSQVTKFFPRVHNSIHFYSKNGGNIFNPNEVLIPYDEETLARSGRGAGLASAMGTTEGGDRLRGGGKTPEDYWKIPIIQGNALEKIGYPTQKPEVLLERIIKVSSNKEDLVADFFCGSGTTAAVAEKLGRKWIVTDLGKFAIHTTRKRMIGVQRQLKTEDKNYRAFEILNLGKYERQLYVGVNPNLREEEQQKQLEEKEAEFLNLILNAYRAEKTEGFHTFHGKKAGRLVVVGPVNMPVTRLFVEEIILECRKKHITKVDILGFEFEMGLFPNVLDDAKAKGIDIAPKYIPADVFDKRAVEKNQVVFHDVSFIEVKPHIKKNSVAVELIDFSVFYSQGSIAVAEADLKNKGSKIVVEKGQIVKISKDNDGIVHREKLTKKWTDWVDYWSVDFDFESKREIIRIKKPSGEQKALKGIATSQIPIDEYEEVWTGDYVFENEWQSFRTKKDRSLELTSVFHECTPGRRKIAVKVVDIFGNDTMKIIEVNIKGKS
ncbi:MAG: site-specific DNA-methyltransferase [Nitrospinota bacterium]|nr:site-specific DNA-methyltransferase [Nitrospinota bacterium]